MQEEGTIHLIIGPMFSGKSTRLIETVRKYASHKKTVFLKYLNDKRYTESQITTHDKFQYDSLTCIHLKEKKEIIKEYDVIGIDEGQFFDDLVSFCDEVSEMGKIVVVAALSGDYKMKPFNNVSELISKADKIKLMKAFCFYCHTLAGFTMRTIKSNELILIGAGEAYRPVCKTCYKKYNINVDIEHNNNNNENRKFDNICQSDNKKNDAII
jgi:thymidine kinase